VSRADSPVYVDARGIVQLTTSVTAQIVLPLFYCPFCGTFRSKIGEALIGALDREV